MLLKKFMVSNFSTELCGFRKKNIYRLSSSGKNISIKVNKWMSFLCTFQKLLDMTTISLLQVKPK